MLSLREKRPHDFCLEDGAGRLSSVLAASAVGPPLPFSVPTGEFYAGCHSVKLIWKTVTQEEELTGQLAPGLRKKPNPERTMLKTELLLVPFAGA